MTEDEYCNVYDLALLRAAIGILREVSDENVFQATSIIYKMINKLSPEMELESE